MKTDTFAKDRKFIWSILISVLCLVVLFFFKDHLKYVIKTQHINISFDNRSTDTTLSKLKEFKADGWARPKNISIGFDVKAIDDNYDNIFQTADDPATVRLELTQPQTLSLILGSGPSELKVHQITDDFGLNVWHKMEVHIDENKYVEVVLDAEKMLSFTDNNTTYQISRIVVGSGNNKTRNFQGEIKNFNITYELYKYAFLFECLFSLLYFLLCVPLMIVFHRIIVKYSNVSLLPGDQSMYHALFIPGLAAAIVFAAHTTDIFLRRTSYWLPFMLLGISSPFILFVYSKVLRMEITSNLARIAKIFTVISFILLVVFILSNSLPFFSDGSGILAILCLLTSVFCTLTFSGYLASSNDEKNLIFILALITFSLVPWVVMYDMPNWKQFISPLTARPILTTVIFFSITGIVHGYLFSTWKKFSYPTFSDAYPRFNKGMTIVLVASSLLLLLLMSFRSDTLFLGTSELHWEYFTGPIRNLKNGSWLLWDTPSQYGFLNILSASILPFKSSWESLYVFQGILLFVVSGILFKTYLSGSLLKRNIFFSILMTFSSLFFADPDLIGPYLYPSSSVMRFFWCYAILFFLY